MQQILAFLYAAISKQSLRGLTDRWVKKQP